MTDDFSPNDRERLNDLLADQAVFGLAPEEAAEAERLLIRFADVDAEEFDRLAAALDVGFAPLDQAPLPEHLRRLCAQQARDVLKAKTPTLRPAQPLADRKWTGPPPWLGWAVAAVCLGLALVFWWRPAPAIAPVDVAKARTELLNDRDSVTARLDGVGPGSTARGDVVWSNRRQGGYMRLAGVAVNDPSRSQYQLWIFDRKQDERYPVDGGVFNVPATGEVILPIRAPIKVAEPYMFAVTVEKPGGVVVSSRDPVILLGQASTTTR